MLTKTAESVLLGSRQRFLRFFRKFKAETACKSILATIVYLYPITGFQYQKFSNCYFRIV